MTNQVTLTEKDLIQLAEGLMNGAAPAQAAGISKETVEGLYALARNLYVSGNYKDAQTVFQSLCVCEPREYRFWMGLAGSRQGNKDLEKAFEAYQMAAVATDLKNAEPLVYAARCLIQLERKDDARAVLLTAEKLAGTAGTDQKKWTDQAASLLSLLGKED